MKSVFPKKKKNNIAGGKIVRWVYIIVASSSCSTCLDICFSLFPFLTVNYLVRFILLLLRCRKFQSSPSISFRFSFNRSVNFRNLILFSTWLGC
ncbi:hypothetical protein K1719_007934 [Acacia pycnantha]|nr:hypothetical protein K1719_007934 [Acacia pycnantha]